MTAGGTQAAACGASVGAAGAWPVPSHRQGRGGQPLAAALGPVGRGAPCEVGQHGCLPSRFQGPSARLIRGRQHLATPRVTAERRGPASREAASPGRIPPPPAFIAHRTARGHPHSTLSARPGRSPAVTPSPRRPITPTEEPAHILKTQEQQLFKFIQTNERV